VMAGSRISARGARSHRLVPRYRLELAARTCEIPDSPISSGRGAGAHCDSGAREWIG
jgi:hypothetical protein